AISLGGARANEGARTFVVHNDTNEREVGRLRHHRDRRLLGRRRRWWWRGAARRREQGTIACGRQAVERLRCERIGQRVGGLLGWLCQCVRVAVGNPPRPPAGEANTGGPIRHWVPR